MTRPLAIHLTFRLSPELHSRLLAHSMGGYSETIRSALDHYLTDLELGHLRFKK
jgi:predicted DNA-binding protein